MASTRCLMVKGKKNKKGKKFLMHNHKHLLGLLHNMKKMFTILNCGYMYDFVREDVEPRIKKKKVKL